MRSPVYTSPKLKLLKGMTALGSAGELGELGFDGRDIDGLWASATIARQINMAVIANFFMVPLQDYQT